MVKINEIFSSVQGEGPVVGYKQLFIRFCGCNLKCDYCDTEFATGDEYSPEELYSHVIGNYDLNTIHSISLTGGEPLLQTEFLKKFLPLVKNRTKIYLETNGTLFDNLNEIKNLIDIISADIKLESATGCNTFELHDRFFAAAAGLETFAKIVFDENITDKEISKCLKLANTYDIPLVLQPKMTGNKPAVTSEFCERILDKFVSERPDTRLIPQVHKFLNVR